MPGWVKKQATRRQKLGLDELERPWTGRDGVQLRGVRRQEKYPNFVHQVLDLQFVSVCNHHGKDTAGPPVPGTFADCRQEWNFQKKTGKGTLMTKSLLYSYDKDRVLIPIEHAFLQGWDADVSLENINEPLSRETMELWKPPAEELPAKKRSKPRKQHVETVVKKLYGAGFQLGDVGLLLSCSLMAVPNGLFEHEPDGFLFDLTNQSKASKVAIVNPDDMTDLISFINDAEGGADSTDADDLEADADAFIMTTGRLRTVDVDDRCCE